MAIMHIFCTLLKSIKSTGKGAIILPHGVLVSRESHYFLGNRYLLNVIEQHGTTRVKIRRKNQLDLFVPPGADAIQCECVFLAWYRKELKAMIPNIIDKWRVLTGIQVADWGVRRMKTKWGPCNIESRRIWLNLELAKEPIQCLEYVIVHEMVHFLERHHNERFTELMDGFMPSWRIHHDELCKVPLRNEKWK